MLPPPGEPALEPPVEPALEPLVWVTTGALWAPLPEVEWEPPPVEPALEPLVWVTTGVGLEPGAGVGAVVELPLEEVVTGAGEEE